MVRLTRWCIGHRRRLVAGWIAIAIGATALATAVGRNYSTNFSLPGTESQRVSDLLSREYPSQGGDIDTVVFHTSSGNVRDPAVRGAIEPLLAQVARMPHVVAVLSPYSGAGALQVSRDGRTAFASVTYDKRANLLPDTTGKPLVAAVQAVRVPGLRVAAGGAVVEQAEGFSIGPATTIGVIAALLILLITFGSLIAAGMPLITAGIGLITGVALIGIATHLTSMSDVAPQLALMIGLGVGIDYALFIVTRFREAYAASGEVEGAVLVAMNTSGRAVVLAGTTVIIALLGMFALGVTFMYGLAIASVLAVVLTMATSLTVLPALLSRHGARVGARQLRQATDPGGRPQSRWRRWSEMVQAHPWTLALASLAVIAALLGPAVALRMDTSDAGNDPVNTTSRKAFDLLASGFGAGFNGPLLIAAELHSPAQRSALPAVRSAIVATPDIGAVGAPQLSPSGDVAVIRAYPLTAAQALATTELVNRLRHTVLPPLARSSGATLLVGGFTAGSIDFSRVLSSKLPLFIAIVVMLSALLLLVIFRSVVIPVQAALMNLLSIGAALGATVVVFQWGWLGDLLELQKGPVEPWIPVLMFAVVFGLSMDYEVFLISRVREEWVNGNGASEAVADGIALTGRVISAAAAIMICVFLSFMLGNQRTIKEFGFGLAVAVFVDALLVRCVLLPAVLELLGERTWWLPRWLDEHLPHFDVEGPPSADAAKRPAQPRADAGERVGATS
jgi:putative drug exporter of the RND superfamily